MNWYRKKDEHMTLLFEVLRKRGEDDLLVKFGAGRLSEGDIKHAVDIVLGEFCETGLREDDEPNRRGERLDDLMGFLVGELEELEVCASEGREYLF
ncbi:hypothetical protein STSP2_00951 [Anaerohalosphaera lusitana]|uniref:Uncharacterized protein n=1 Tax=Anaerohalosphaera lusitana TaxID=1936003 RepID=A0A1U9NIQ7_9BACT|nr:hypothetical protein [Anaerohalosphaera lusitana]AQT67801.1 hypothetical protein STSP2_00951 [Anaerohalosphaera lusitana]